MAIRSLEPNAQAASCVCADRCPCHVTLQEKAVAAGISLDGLTASERRLLDLLLPVGRYQSNIALSAALTGWGKNWRAQWSDGPLRHALRVNFCRMRPKLAPADLSVINDRAGWHLERCE